MKMKWKRNTHLSVEEACVCSELYLDVTDLCWWCAAVSGGRGRGRAPAGSRFSAQGMGYDSITSMQVITPVFDVMCYLLWDSTDSPVWLTSRTFNPADYTSEASTGTAQTEVWDTAANNSTDGTGEVLLCFFSHLDRCLTLSSGKRIYFFKFVTIINFFAACNTMGCKFYFNV